MSNEEWELKKFIIQHPEYVKEYEKGNLAVNIFSDILRKNPREVIAVSDLPHNLDLIGTRLAKSWDVKETKPKREQNAVEKNITERSTRRRNEQSL